MSIIFWVSIIVVTPFIIFYLSKSSKAKQAEIKRKEEAGRKTSERIINPERKLHEQEKKRWEDEFWRGRAQRDR
ncbi:MAG: hypothetical protein PHF11_06500 [Candidatus Omnitrophica bacterium]|nr:hypothetical protein [Candidatus Omnitrophota bacterium]